MTDSLRIIGRDDLPDNELPEELGEKDLLEIFRSMVVLRVFDERAVALQRQGRLGTYALYWGEEATQAGPLYACSERDWIFPSYRQNAIGILRAVPASTIFAWWRGYGGREGFYNVREHRVGPICVPIATHLPHAVGVSWASKLRGERDASLVWFGDGATSEGDFHEAMNFAGVFKTPTIFFCVNNQWAISTPVHKQTAVEVLADKAAAYGMPGIRVDGFDPIACWKATHDALERARAGGGPSFIEAYCYRLGAHGTADDPRLYRNEAEAANWKRLEPLARTSAYLKRIAVLDDDLESELFADAKKSIASAVAEMEALEHPSLEILFDQVYASRTPWTFEESLRELQSVERPPEVKPLGAQPGPPSTGDADAPVGPS